jgi:hypothetical protein
MSRSGQRSPDLGERGLLLVIEAGGIAEDPARDVAGLRRRRDGGRGGAEVAERLDVVADGAVAAVTELGVQLPDG